MAKSTSAGTVTDSVLRADHISVKFGGLVAVDDVSFDIPKGSIVSLIGPNGAGKTTFFNVLTGLYKPTSGAVNFNGQNITARPPHKIAQAGMARTFQNIRLFSLMTAEENVMVAMHSHLKSGILATVFGTPGQRREEREAKERARELLEYVGIGKTAGQFARNLSYGDQRRLEVARALALNPSLLLLVGSYQQLVHQEATSLDLTPTLVLLLTDVDRHKKDCEQIVRRFCQYQRNQVILERALLLLALLDADLVYQIL